MDMEQLRKQFEGKREEAAGEGEKRGKGAFSIKKLRKDQLLILVLAGILILVIAIPLPDGTGKETQPAAVKETAQEAGGQTEQDYASKLEHKLEEALSYVEGVGSARVMITLKASAEQVVEKDRPYVRNSVNETDAGGGSRTTTEITNEEETVYINEGNGGTKPYVVKELTPEIEGIVVIVSGGQSPYVISEVTSAVQALFPIEAHKIKVMKMK